MRSYTIDDPYSSGDRPRMQSLPSLSDDEPATGSLESDKDDSPPSALYTSQGKQEKMTSKENQASITNRYSLLDDPVPASITSQPSLAVSTSSSSTSTPLLEPSSTKPADNSSSSIRPVPEPRRFYGRREEDQRPAALYKPDSVETKQAGVAQVSASLPRSYQRSDSARLTSVVTPRPFGTQTNRISSLPRSYTVRGFFHLLRFS